MLASIKRSIAYEIARRFFRNAFRTEEPGALRRRLRPSQRYFKSLKNKYRGRRGFVIGNGPSLRIEDLIKLNNEVTIASNGIYLAFDEVAWRPTHYTVVDPLVWEKSYAQIAKRVLVPIIPSYLPDKRYPCHVTRYLGNAADIYKRENVDCFSNDLRRGLFGGYTVTFENLQLAIYLGLDPIYIIGCDHYYEGEASEVVADTKIRNRSTSNHFLPGYRKEGDVVNVAAIPEMTISYEIAARYGKTTGRTIVNATRGGHLEVFPRDEFDSLFADL